MESHLLHGRENEKKKHLTLVLHLSVYPPSFTLFSFCRSSLSPRIIFFQLTFLPVVHFCLFLHSASIRLLTQRIDHHKQMFLSTRLMKPDEDIVTLEQLHDASLETAVTPQRRTPT